MKTSDFDYYLPPRLIAQTPVEPRDHSRLMVISRADGTIEHRHFYDIEEYLREGDVLVCNESRVIPARLLARRAESGGKAEILLLRRLEEGLWEALARPSRKMVPGASVVLLDKQGQATVQAEVVGKTEAGTRLIRFSQEETLESLGVMPLPPYIREPLGDPERYQTVYSRVKGSAAAPTAGLHFTPELLARLRSRGIDVAFVILHVGLDTFRPVRGEDVEHHKMHREYYELSPEVADSLTRARIEGRRIIAVGTTTTRVLEEAARQGRGEDSIEPYAGWTDLFIRPGHRFRALNGLITNFHLPRSTLLMLVSAFAGKELLFRAYEEAMRGEYHFYSFGDAMLIT